MFSCRNNTGKALTLLDGERTLVVIASGQQAQNIQLLVTNVKLGGASVIYRRKAGAFVDGAAYAATIVNKDVLFVADGQPDVVFG